MTASSLAPIDPAAFHAALDSIFGFVGFDGPRKSGFARQDEVVLPAEIAKARAHFYAAGWSYRSAAAELGVSYQHLCEVLTGKRTSRRLIAAVLQLTTRSQP